MKITKLIVYLLFLPVIGLLSACTSNIPIEIRQELEMAPDVAQVRAHSEIYIGQKVRWGGVIVDTENRDNTSRLTVVAFPLNGDGEPDSSMQSTGRFIAVVDAFLEPTLFAPDRLVTVVGRLLETETINVGEFPYEYPVVQSEHNYLWPVKQEPVYYDYPVPYWYDPWYPYYYPYYSHPRYH